jgi:quercetin dioxygenase-like cupin family protein
MQRGRGAERQRYLYRRVHLPRRLHRFLFPELQWRKHELRSEVRRRFCAKIRRPNRPMHLSLVAAASTAEARTLISLFRQSKVRYRFRVPEGDRIMPESFVRKQSEGQPLWFLGSLFDIKLTGEETSGQLTVIELTVGPQRLAAPPHTHNGGETVYMLDGTLRFHVGDRTVDAGAGSTLHPPKGAWEWFENITDKPARALIVYSPGGIDKFFKELGEPAKRREVPPAPAQPDLERIAKTAAKYGMQVKPPPGR